MSRRGAGSRSTLGDTRRSGSTRYEFVRTPSFGRSVMELVHTMRGQGLAPLEIASLMAHAASILAKCRTESSPPMTRDDFLELCGALWDRPLDGGSGGVPEGGTSTDKALTSPGGTA